MLRMKAYELSRIDQLELMSIEAFWSSRAGATDRNGKYVIKTPSQLFDKHKQEKAILGTRTIKELEEHKRLAALTRRVQALEGGENV